MKNPIAMCLATLLLPSLAMAQNQSDWSDWTMGARYTVQLELFHPTLNTRLRIDSSDGTPGKPIDLEQDLGMSETETLPALMLGWRVAKRHRLLLSYYELDRSGSAITDTTIRIGDIEFEVDLPISSFLDMDVLTVGYSYSLLFDEKREFAIGAGLTLMDIRFGIFGNGSQGVIEADTALTAPLPNIGLTGGYAFTENLYFEAAAGYFFFDLAVSDETNIRGNVATATAGVYHNTFKYVRFGLDYKFYDVDVDWGNASGFNSLQYTYHGPSLSVAATF
jgi:hypothetical protein